MKWIVTLLDNTVAAELSAMPADIRARFSRIVGLVEEHGLELVREPHVKHIEGRLWEMRMSGRDGIARAFYVTASGRRVVVVHVYSKKTQRSPRRVIEYALRRAEEVE